MVKRLLMVGTVALGLLAVGIAPALADSASYVGQGGVATCAIPVGNTVTVPAAGVGGACFEVPAGATQAAIEAHDDFGPPPVLAVSFGVFGGYALCDGSGTVNVTGETQMGVFADNTASAVWGCLRPSVPLRGTITVTFS